MEGPIQQAGLNTLVQVRQVTTVPAGGQSLPSTLELLPQYSVISGTVTGRDGQGFTLLDTLYGKLAVKTEIDLQRFLTRGMEVTLRMEPSQLQAELSQARIIAVDGKPVHLLNKPIGEPPPVIIEPHMEEEAPVSYRPPAGTPYPSNPMATATQAAGQVVMSPMALPVFTTTLMPAITPSQQQLLASILGMRITPQVPLPQAGDRLQLRMIAMPSTPAGGGTSTVPATAPPPQMSGAAAMPNPVTPATPASGPSLPETAPIPGQGGGQTPQLQSTAPATHPTSMPPSSTPTSGQATPAGVQQQPAALTPQLLPQANAGMANPTAERPMPRLLAQILPSPQPGAPMQLQTAIGSFPIPTALKLPEAASWQVEILGWQPIGGQPVEEGGEQEGLSRWQSTEQMLQMVKEALLPGPAQAFRQAMPQLTPGFAVSVMLFLQSLQGGKPERWLGEHILSRLETDEQTKPLLGKLSQEWGAARTLWQETSQQPWQATLMPFLLGEELHTIRYFERRESEHPEGGDQHQRFILELDLSRLGPMQLDGFFKRPSPQSTTIVKPQFDLTLRTLRPMTEEFQTESSSIYYSTLEALGLNGVLRFSVDSQFPTAEVSRSVNAILGKTIK